MKTFIAAAAITTLMAGTAVLAGQMQGTTADTVMHQAKDALTGVTIKQVEGNQQVTVSGKVVEVNAMNQAFIIKDETGEISVEQADGVAVLVGDEVTVSGTVRAEDGAKEIAATKVTITKAAEAKEKEQS